jgi:hypothetical protein
MPIETGRNDTRADPLLPERARSECARSTAAVGPTRVPFRWREASELGRIIEKDGGGRFALHPWGEQERR